MFRGLCLVLPQWATFLVWEGVKELRGFILDCREKAKPSNAGGSLAFGMCSVQPLAQQPEPGSLRTQESHSDLFLHLLGPTSQSYISL